MIGNVKKVYFNYRFLTAMELLILFKKEEIYVNIWTLSDHPKTKAFNKITTKIQ